jgi:hypothetical protein
MVTQAGYPVFTEDGAVFYDTGIDFEIWMTTDLLNVSFSMTIITVEIIGQVTSNKYSRHCIKRPLKGLPKSGLLIKWSLNKVVSQ